MKKNRGRPINRAIKNFILTNFSFNHIYRPLNAQIELTCRCNGRCIFCSIWEKDFQDNLKPEMTTAEILHVIDGIDRLGVMALTLTGGEPLLRGDLKKIIDYAAGKGLLVTLVTNGYHLFDKVLDGTVENARWFMVSLDWPDAKRHDEYRGIPVYDRAIKGIKAAIKAGKIVLISTVVTKDNLDQMENLVLLARSLGCMIELLPCEDIIREQEEKVHVVQKIDSYVPNLHIWSSEIRRLAKIYPNILTDSVSANIIESGGFGGNQNRLFCEVAKAFVTVGYSGELLLPCKIHPILKIDVKKMDVDKAYYSKEAKQIMDYKDSFPFCKGCRLGCAIASSIPIHWNTLYEKYGKGFLNGNFFSSE